MNTYDKIHANETKIEAKLAEIEALKRKNEALMKSQQPEVIWNEKFAGNIAILCSKTHEEATVTCALINKVLYVEKGIVHVDVAWFAAIDIEHASCSYSAGKSDYVVDTSKIDIELVDDENDAEYVTKFVEFAKTFVDTYTKEAMAIAEQEKHV